MLGCGLENLSWGRGGKVYVLAKPFFNPDPGGWGYTLTFDRLPMLLSGQGGLRQAKTAGQPVEGGEEQAQIPEEMTSDLRVQASTNQEGVCG